MVRRATDAESPGESDSARGLLARRAAVALGAAALAAALALPAGSASAHAQLISITPANDAMLDAPPSDVVLLFSEPVSLTGGSVRVLDDSAAEVSAEPVLEGDTITAPLVGDLADGTYTVVYEVISADSHRISGASVFHVGEATSAGLDAADVGGDDVAWPIRFGAASLSAIGYAGALIAAGTAVFPLYAGVAIALGGITSRAAILGSIALLGALPFRIARLGGGLDALRDDALLTEALRGPIGVSTAVSSVALLALAVLVEQRRHRDGLPPRWWLAVAAVVVVAALGGFSLEGHTRATTPSWAMVGSDVVHLAAGAVWLGGVVGLAVAFRSRADAVDVAVAVRRFSAAALVAVGVVAATGVVMAWIILPTAGELTSTGWGLALITKVSLVVVVVALGAFNRYRLVPVIEHRRQSAAETARRWLARIVSAELVVLLGVVAVTAVLVTRSPLGAAAAPAESAPSPTPAPTTVTADVVLSGDAGIAAVTVSPGVVGTNTIEVELRDAEGRIVNPVDAPVIELSQPALDVGPLRPEVLPLAIGRYEASAELAFPGEWEVGVRVRVSDFESANGTGTVTIAE